MTKMRNSKLFLLLLVAVLFGCSESKQVKKSVRAVKVARVTSLEQSANKIILPSTINERSRVDLAFRVGGPLVMLNNIVGSYVTKGQVIASIDDRDFKVGLSKAESHYTMAKAEYERYKTLLEQNSVSKSVFDKIEAQYILAKGNYDDAKNANEDTRLRAPFSGYIDMVYVDNYEKVNPGQPIVSFLDLSTYKVVAWISEQDAKSVSKDTKFITEIETADTTFRVEGKLLELGAKAGFSKQSYPISVVINAPEGVKLRAGMTAKLEIFKSDAASANYCVVPVTSVFSKDDNAYVWIYKDGSVQKRKVILGKILSEDDIIIEKGLNDNEIIVSAGVNYLQQGETVKVYNVFSKTNIGNQL